ncbi:MAG: hypothetical protein RL567_1212 [Bacteroidota bacterium]|jgi:hypothetical protein
MELFTATILALAIGLTVGMKFKKIRKTPVPVDPMPAMPNRETGQISFEQYGLSIHFDTLEIRFLTRITDSESKALSVSETNEILRIEKLSKENQRQRRHLFLKDLNVKLKMIFNVNESIERQSTEYDRRSKYYSLHHNINKSQLKELIAKKK